MKNLRLISRFRNFRRSESENSEFLMRISIRHFLHKFRLFAWASLWCEHSSHAWMIEIFGSTRKVLAGEMKTRIKKLIFTVFVYFLMCSTTKMFIFNFVMRSGFYRLHELSASNNWKRCSSLRSNAGETETRYRHTTIRRALSAIYRHWAISAAVVLCDLISSLSKLEIANSRIDSFYGSIKPPQHHVAEFAALLAGLEGREIVWILF